MCVFSEYSHRALLIGALCILIWMALRRGCFFFFGVFGDVYTKLSAIDSSCESMPTLECGSFSDVI